MTMSCPPAGLPAFAIGKCDISAFLNASHTAVKLPSDSEFLSIAPSLVLIGPRWGIESPVPEVSRCASPTVPHPRSTPLPPQMCPRLHRQLRRPPQNANQGGNDRARIPWSHPHYAPIEYPDPVGLQS